MERGPDKERVDDSGSLACANTAVTGSGCQTSKCIKIYLAMKRVKKEKKCITPRTRDVRKERKAKHAVIS